MGEKLDREKMRQPTNDFYLAAGFRFFYKKIVFLQSL